MATKRSIQRRRRSRSSAETEGAKQDPRRAAPSPAAPETPAGPPPILPPRMQSLTTSGAAPQVSRQLVFFRRQGMADGVKALSTKSGVKLASTREAKSGVLSIAQRRDAQGVLYERLGVAVVDGDPDRVRAARVAALSDPAVVAVSRVRPVYASQDLLTQYPEYLLGFRDGVRSMGSAGAGEQLLESALAESGASGRDERQFTWGLQAVGAEKGDWTGAGVRVAVLDTGLDMEHEDFVGRVSAARSQSFVPGAADAQDGHGHGTHCAGTVCGPQSPYRGPQYGVAPDAELWVAKVLADDGKGYNDYFVAALEWALANDCRIASMSLGGEPDHRFDDGFEFLADQALDQNLLIVAAAGNDSDHQRRHFRPVNHPADCPSIMAIGAVDIRRSAANFTNRSLSGYDGQVDLVGPGVDVHSSLTGNRYTSMSGTSMATPHVSGIAALLAEKYRAEKGREASARELWQQLAASAKRLPLRSTDCGCGLVQAPS